MSDWGAMVVYAVTLPALYTVARRRSVSVSINSPVALALGTAGAAVVALGSLHGTPVSLGTAIALACLVVCAHSDLATGLVFDVVTVSAAGAIFAWSLIQQRQEGALIGACVCIAPLLGLYSLTRGRGIGLGDVKLCGIIGAGLGGVWALGAIGAAFVAGALCCLPLLVARRMSRTDRVPFAPFLAIGTFVLIATVVVQSHG